MAAEDINTVGLSEQSHKSLRLPKDTGVFSEMRDAYRFGLAWAIAAGIIADEDVKTTETFVNVGTLDPDGSIRDVVIGLFPEAENRPYARVERLAEAGVAAIGLLHETDQLRFKDLFGRIAETQLSTNQGM